MPITPAPDPAPPRVFAPVQDYWRSGELVLEVAGASAATIADATGIIAELTTGGTAPIGSYASTTYGESVYGGPYTITVAAEPGTSAGIPDATVLNPASASIQAGTYEAATAASWVSTADPDWTIQWDTPDGTAELLYDGTAIATRTDGPADHPGGAYESTEYGATSCNGSVPFSVFVLTGRVPPRAGVVYVTITETAGVLTAAAGPFFATELPANTATEYHFPIALCDGANPPVQIHEGPIHWPPPGGEPDPTTRNMIILGI